jgi:peptidoglycan/LPS O-acetylase OafA/YrhL
LEPLLNYKKINLFNGLNALRFFAAFLVVLHHTETIRKKNNLLNFEWLGLFRNGGNAVAFFFVLSGFLITYLLLREYNETEKISIRNFYIKRILRIWPLYFLLIFLGVILLPLALKLAHIAYDMPYSFSQTWYYFLFFVPGLVTYYFGSHLLQPLWSIGVEEVFYLIWAPIAKVSKHKLLWALLIILALKLIFFLMCGTIITHPVIIFLLSSFQFELMIIGGLGAYFIYHSTKDISTLIIFSRPFQILIFTVLIFSLLFNCNIQVTIFKVIFETPFFSSLFLGILFLYTIINISLNKNALFKLNNAVLNYLGEISYGIYMYHMLCLFTTVQLFKMFAATMNPKLSALFFYIVLITLVITVSGLSKKYFENHFILLRKRLLK